MTPRPPASPGRALACSLLGAALLQVPAHTYGVDRVLLLSCASWPSAADSALAFGGSLLALALLTWGWLGLARPAEGPPLRTAQVLLYGALVHAVAALNLPFLSNDPVYYSAIGKAMARF